MSGLQIKQTRRNSIRQAANTLNPEPLLTVPRNRTQDSLTHLAFGTNGDVIRGRLIDLNTNQLRMWANGGNVNLSRTAVAGLVWLDDKLVESPIKPRTTPRVVLNDTSTISMAELRMRQDQLVGSHTELGRCIVPLEEVQSILMGDAPNQFHQYVFSDWQARLAPAPKFAPLENDGHRVVSPLVGQSAQLDATMLATGEPFDLQQRQGSIVVLAFWASWSAPCIRNMPQLLRLVDEYPDDVLQLVAVNQGEEIGVVAAAVAAREWQLAVALDPEAAASRSLQVESLPTTILVDQRGDVSAVFVGASGRLQHELKLAIDSLLGE